MEAITEPKTAVMKCETCGHTLVTREARETDTIGINIGDTIYRKKKPQDGGHKVWRILNKWYWVERISDNKGSDHSKPMGVRFDDATLEQPVIGAPKVAAPAAEIPAETEAVEA